LAPAVCVPAASFAAIYADSAPPAASQVAEYRHSRAVDSADYLYGNTASDSFRNLAPDDNYHDISPQILSNSQKFPGTAIAIPPKILTACSCGAPRY
jgi:hypothetical protein